MPDALELPGMRRAVVPGMSACNSVVYEFVAYRIPRGSAVIRLLDLLTEPARTLRRVKTIRVRGRSLHVVHLPSCEMRTAHAPLLAFPVSRKNEGPFARPHQHSYTAHSFFVSFFAY